MHDLGNGAETPLNPRQVAVPSLWLYAAILITAGLLVAVAFTLLGKPDWPGLFLNVGAGLIGSVVVIVVVDRRLRSSELSALRNIPHRTDFTLRLLMNPNLQVAKAYSQSILLDLEPQLRYAVARPALTCLVPKIETGFVLIGYPLFGKTTWMRQMAAQYARQFLDGRRGAKVIVLLGLRDIWPEAGLSKAIVDDVQGRTRCSVDRAEKLLRSGLVILLLDGYDEIPAHLKTSFLVDLANLRGRFARIALTISSRPVPESPMTDAEVVVMPPPTSQELSDIRRRQEIDQEPERPET